MSNIEGEWTYWDWAFTALLCFAAACFGALVAIGANDSAWAGLADSTAAGWIATVATIVGVALIARTLSVTQSTLKEAKAATEAANRTVDETKRIGEAQARAYVQVDGGRFWFFRQDEIPKSETSLHVEVDIVNTGQTPARRLRLDGALSIETGDEKTTVAGSKQVFGRRIALGANASYTFKHTFRQVPKHALMPANLLNISVDLKYKSVFKKTGGERENLIGSIDASKTKGELRLEFDMSSKV